MERTLYDKDGMAVAYIAEDFHSTIYLWEGTPAAYLHEDEHVYGFNGRHLGWFKNEVLFNHKGERVGFLFTSCPVSVKKPPVKWKKSLPDEKRPRWSGPSLAKLGYQTAQESLADFLKQGLIDRATTEAPSAAAPEAREKNRESGESAGN